MTHDVVAAIDPANDEPRLLERIHHLAAPHRGNWWHQATSRTVIVSSSGTPNSANQPSSASRRSATASSGVCPSPLAPPPGSDAWADHQPVSSCSTVYGTCTTRSTKRFYLRLILWVPRISSSQATRRYSLIMPSARIRIVGCHADHELADRGRRRRPSGTSPAGVAPLARDDVHRAVRRLHGFPRRLRHPGCRGSGVRRPAQLTDLVMWAACPPGEHGLRGGKWDHVGGPWRGERS